MRTATEADIKRNKELDQVNLWGERSYFCNCHRDGGDYAWLTNNLSSAPEFADAGTNQCRMDVRRQMESGK